MTQSHAIIQFSFYVVTIRLSLCVFFTFRLDRRNFKFPSDFSINSFFMYLSKDIVKEIMYEWKMCLPRCDVWFSFVSSHFKLLFMGALLCFVWMLEIVKQYTTECEMKMILIMTWKFSSFCVHSTEINY